MIFFIGNTKTDSRARHGGADCAPIPGGPWAQYIDRSAPCLPARQVRVRWLLDVLGCFLVVCQVFVFCRMLDARWNLDLESPEELLTSSRTPGPRAPHSRPMGPSGPMAFWRFIFASFFVMCFCIVFSCFLMNSDLHFGAMLASFSMFFFFDYFFFGENAFFC